MRTLILMRHAKSDWKQPGTSDHDRPLNKRGRMAAPRMAEHFRRHALSVDVILASTAERVRQTVELLQEIWCPEAEVIRSRSLYLASPEQIASEVQGLPDEWTRALVVGHNPGLGTMAGYLAEQYMDFPTAAVAVFQADADSWRYPLSPERWNLSCLWRPRELEADPS